MLLPETAFAQWQPFRQVVQPRTQVVQPRTQVVQPRTVVIQPRTQVVQPRTQVVQPRTVVIQPRTQVVQPYQQIQTRTSSAAPKIHSLFVWGTKATDTHWATKISQKEIEGFFDGLDDRETQTILAETWGYPRNHKVMGTKITLEGDRATPQNIQLACRRLASIAQPNDAIFVYILCHGASFVEDDDTTGTRRHALSPIAKSAEALDLRGIGIRRETILEVMKSGPRPPRLTMLVTDACSNFVASEPSQKPRTERIGDWHASLVALLLTAKGTININSSDPNGGAMNRGELAMAWVPDEPEKYYKRVYIDRKWNEHDQRAGTLFTEAFLRVACTGVDLPFETEPGPVQFDVMVTPDMDAEIATYGRNSFGHPPIYDKSCPFYFILGKDPDPNLPLPSFVRGEGLYSPEEFQELFLIALRKSLSDVYAETIQHAMETHSRGISVLMGQPTQTLTRFDDRGVALP